MTYTKAQRPRPPSGLELISDTVQVGLTVGDFEKSLSFYADLLGFDIFATAAVVGGGTVTQIGRGDVRLNLLHDLARPPAPNHPGGVGPAPGGGSMPGGQLGLRWFTFKVLDLSAILERATSRGDEVAVPLTQANDNAKFAILRDPDGNSVEFVEYVDVSRYEERGHDQ